MRCDADRETALECLRIAATACRDSAMATSYDVLPLARDFYAFATGKDVSVLIEEAKAAIDRVAR